MTVLEVIQRSTEFLAEKGVESPRLQIELMLADVLALPRLQLYLNFQRALSAAEVEQLRAMVRRRGLREPLQYILGSTSFCGLEIACTPAALVPRPETEMLAERGWKFLQNRGAPARALDIGTGTGCIAVALAAHAPNAHVVAVDLSPEALNLAQENAARHGLTERMEFRLGNAFDVLDPAERFHLIISNPPYIPSGEIGQLQPEVRQFEPRLALDGGVDGLDVFRQIGARGPALLHPEGRLMLEFSDGQAPALKTLLETQNWIVEEIIDDYSAQPRILIARSD